MISFLLGFLSRLLSCGSRRGADTSYVSQYIIFYIECRVSNSGYPKNVLYFHFMVPTTPTRAPLGKGGRPVGEICLLLSKIDHMFNKSCSFY